MKTIRDIDISGKRTLIRVDFNVPLDEKGRITDDARIRRVLPTVEYALEKGAKLILASHLGRPKGQVMPAMGLAPVAQRLSELTGKPVQLAPDAVGPEVEKMVSDMQPGDILLLENLRFHAEEQADDEGFARQLASLCDVYVNDAFAVSHRANASVVAVTRFAPVCVAGLLLEKELEYFHRAMTDPRRPLAAVIGGAKVSSKLAALHNLLRKVDKLIIGGAMANTFLRGMGCDMGSSKIEEDLIGDAAEIVAEAQRRKVRLYLPVDAVAARELSDQAPVRTLPVQEIPEGLMALDIGPATAMLYAEALEDAGTIVWNGPMGVFEMVPFSKGTAHMVKTVAASAALTIVGGGDTGAAVHQSGLAEKISYISTGGGAFLKLLEGHELPAVAALEKAAETA